MEDLRQLVKQVDELVRSKGRWRSGVLGAAGPNSPRSLSAQKRSPQESAEDNVPDRIALDTLQNGIKTPRSTSPTQSRGSPYERDGSTRPSRLETPVPRTPGGASTSQTSSPNRETTKRGLHLPLLHSSIINLQIRHHNLSSTGLARTGALLDKMIHCAGPLKDLGGPSGPTRYAGEQNESGAVPDALLEVQEGLEAEVEQVGEEIALCRQLEQQWEL